MLERILAVVDSSKEGARALKMAVELAHEIGADLKVITVLQPVPSYFSFAVSAILAEIWSRSQREKCVMALTDAKRQMKRAGIYPDAEMVTGEKVGTILRCIGQYQADIVVMALKHSTFVIDRTVQDVVERCSCPVLEVP